MYSFTLLSVVMNNSNVETNYFIKYMVLLLGTVDV
jgi:hypothetical protein